PEHLAESFRAERELVRGVWKFRLEPFVERFQSRGRVRRGQLEFCLQIRIRDRREDGGYIFFEETSQPSETSPSDLDKSARHWHAKVVPNLFGRTRDILSVLSERLHPVLERGVRTCDINARVESALRSVIGRIGERLFGDFDPE